MVTEETIKAFAYGLIALGVILVLFSVITYYVLYHRKDRRTREYLKKCPRCKNPEYACDCKPNY